MNKRLFLLLILAGLIITSDSFSAPHRALDLANTCAGCHGTDGNSSGPATPSLAGISAEYFIAAMTDYKDPDGRYATIMSRIATAYSSEEIKLMADYFSQQKMRYNTQAFDVTQAKYGAKLHDKYCERCHEDGGRSADDDAGILAGQWREYLRYSLDDFQHKRRKMPRKMKIKVRRLLKRSGNDGLSALMHFYASQQ
ncbi:c-type cytochrome [sulfur-oxidizing endosymbiont of Gigantopelta aegis]|uniref:c-type cytochrome n=1 Tax=sulfur-oxidizing endosymbiont of Gigantopelta aegis TaxID=2794934 RepID=UPI001FEBB6D0|nr:c-type cytochrome [sulfur-oxidizing endosymbiont of Gigantopelta aegis]